MAAALRNHVGREEQTLDQGWAIELRGVTQRLAGDVVALQDVSLQIGDGEFFSLLGPSGCGKTTSLRLIAGFEMPSEGEVLIAGQAQGLTPPFQRPVNTVFQNYALFPHLSVEPLGALDLKLRKAMQLELKALQDRVGITFVYVTHDQEEALTMSDRIAVMNRGSLLPVGTPSEIY